jgi:hypothetical protein
LHVSSEILFEHASSPSKASRKAQPRKLQYGTEQETRVFAVVCDEDEEERACTLFYLTREEGRDIG